MSTPTEFVFASTPSESPTQANAVAPPRSTAASTVKAWIDINVVIEHKATLLRMLALDLARDNRTGRSSVRVDDVAVPMHCIVQRIGNNYEVDMTTPVVDRLSTIYDAQDNQHRYSSNNVIYVAVPILFGAGDDEDDDEDDEDDVDDVE